MLTRTSELAFRAVLFLGLQEDDQPWPPRRIAKSLECSPSYLAKTLGMLVRAGLLRSVKGAHGGVLLAQSPEQITLLDIVEACQGLLIANYCQELASHREPVCAFHQAMRELHAVTTGTLSKWTLKDLMARPTSLYPASDENLPCKMAFLGCEKFMSRKKMKGGARRK